MIRDNIDLLLLDLNLPGNSGWDVFGTLTSLNPFLPIIIITGRDNQHELAAEAGVGALMEKPLDLPMLLKTITELLAESSETRLNDWLDVVVIRFASRQGCSRIPQPLLRHKLKYRINQKSVSERL